MNALETKYRLKKQGSVTSRISFVVLMCTVACFYCYMPLEKSSFEKEFWFIVLLTVSVTTMIYGKLLTTFGERKKTFKVLFLIYFVVAVISLVTFYY